MDRHAGELYEHCRSPVPAHLLAIALDRTSHHRSMSAAWISTGLFDRAGAQEMASAPVAFDRHSLLDEFPDPHLCVDVHPPDGRAAQYAPDGRWNRGPAYQP